MGLSRKEIKEIQKKYAEEKLAQQVMTFTFDDGQKSIVVNTSEMALNKVIKVFDDFIRGCGYGLNNREEILVWNHDMEPMKDFGEE